MHYLIIATLLLWADIASASWDHIGPHGGLITTIIEDKDGNIYAGTEGSGVFKSNDGGETWVSMSKGFVNPFVSAMAITGKGTILAGTRGGAYKSIDSGGNWEIITTLPIGLLVSHIMVDRNDTIYVAIWGDGVYKSKDGGATWEVLKEGLSNPFVNSLVIDREGNLYAGTEGGVFKSQGAGPPWIQVGLIESIVTTMVIDDNGVIYAGTWRDTAFKSRDGGKSWEGLGRGISSYIKSFSIGKGGVIYAGTEDGVFSLSPGASQWTSHGLSKVLISSVAALGNRVYAGSHGKGLYIYKEGIWKEGNIGITNYEVLSMDFDREGNLYVGTSWGLFKRDKTGQWGEVKEHAGRRIQTLLVRDRVIYAGTPSGLFETRTSRDGWVRTKGEVGFLNITSIIADGKGGIYVGTDGDGVFRGKEDRDTWVPLSEGLASLRVSSLVMDSSGDIHAGTYRGVFRLSKDKTGWEDIGKGLENKLVLSLTIDKGGNLYAGTDGGGVFLFERDGWKVMNEGLGGRRVFSIAGDTLGNLYAGTRSGIFLKTGDDPAWKDITRGLINIAVQTIAIDKGDRVYIGTWGAGVCVKR